MAKYWTNILAIWSHWLPGPSSTISIKVWSRFSSFLFRSSLSENVLSHLQLEIFARRSLIFWRKNLRLKIILLHRRLVRSIPRLNTILPSTGQNNCFGNILFYETSLFIVKLADHDGNHRCLLEKNVPVAFILPSRWHDGAKSLGMETASCLW